MAQRHDSSKREQLAPPRSREMASRSNSTRPVMLLVLGPHRSGTSLTTRALECLGAANSRNLNPADACNPTGYFEDYDVFQFNENILLPRLGKTWYALGPIDWDRLSKNDEARLRLDAVDIVRRNYDQTKLVSVLKEPRLARLLPFWLPALDQAGFACKCVMPIRDPLSVAKSLAKRNGFSLTQGAAIYLRSWLDIINDAANLPYGFVLFEDLIASPAKALRCVAAQIDLPIPQDFEQQVDRFAASHLHLNLVHNISSPDELRSEPNLHELVIRFYEVLLSVSRGEKKGGLEARAASASSDLSPLKVFLDDYDRLAALQEDHKQLKVDHATLLTEMRCLAAESARMREQAENRSKQINALLGDLARSNQLLQIVRDRVVLADGYGIRINEIRACESRSSGPHRHLSIDFMEVTLPCVYLVRLRVRLVQHHGKPGLALFQDSDQRSPIMNDWVESGMESGSPFMLVIPEDEPAKEWLSEASASDYRILSFFTRAIVTFLAAKQTPACICGPDADDSGAWLSVAEALAEQLAALPPTLRYDSVSVASETLDPSRRQDFVLKRVSLGQAFIPQLRFTWIPRPFGGLLRMPSDQLGAPFTLPNSGADVASESYVERRIWKFPFSFFLTSSTSSCSVAEHWLSAIADVLPTLIQKTVASSYMHGRTKRTNSSHIHCID